MKCPNCGTEVDCSPEKEIVHSHEDCNGTPYGYVCWDCPKCFHMIEKPNTAWYGDD